MKLDIKNILIVGLGLIGGSYADALTEKGYTVRAITRSQRSVDFARKKGWISEGDCKIHPEWIEESDLIIFALYPAIFLDWIRENQKYFSPGTILTDVTGVKTGVVYPIQEFLREDVEFIASHPMAGREVIGDAPGVESADRHIFHNANFIVTPTEKNTEKAILFCEELGRELGFASVSRLSPEEHDDMIAFLSQLTHVIAVNLMTCNETPNMEFYTGDSFRDLTRIARINDQMWSELFLLNRDALIKHMDEFSAGFERFRQQLLNGDRDAMRETMKKSFERRARFDKKKPIPQEEK